MVERTIEFDNFLSVEARRACQSLRDLVTIVRDAPAGPHILFNLPSNFDLYLAGLEKRQRQNYRRDKNLLDKNFEMRGDVLKDPLETLAAFLEFKTLHTSQWEEEGKSGHFGDWPDSEAFNADLANELSRLGRFRMANGSHSFTATDTVSGVTSAASGALNVTVDTAAPAAPVITGDTIVNTNRVQLTGTAEANSKVTVFDGATALGTATADASGACPRQSGRSCCCCST